MKIHDTTVSATIFMPSSKERGETLLYPFYSIRENRTELIEDYRKWAQSHSIPFKEIVVPGDGVNEVGFLVQEDILATFGSLDSDMSDELYSDFGSWAVTPKLAPIPAEINIPPEYMPNLEASLASMATMPMSSKEDLHVWLVNPQTTEALKLTFFYEKVG